MTEHLGMTFDWMSVPHARLYRMVTEKLNPEVGLSAAEEWTALGRDLASIGDELATLARDVEGAWSGHAAHLAVDGITALSRWARHTGDRATEVGGCVATAADNAARARAAMPPVVDAEPAFDGGFGGAPRLLVDQHELVQREHDRHAAAARVMDQFQAASRDVAKTVPRFVPPDPHKTPKLHGEKPSAAASAADATTPAFSAAGAGSSGAGSGGGFGGGAVGGGTPGDALGAGGLRAGIATTPAPLPAAAVAPAPGTTPSPGGFGAMPMGAPTSGGASDRERRGLGFLEEPSPWEFAEGDLMVSAAVIGELPRHE